MGGRGVTLLQGRWYNGPMSWRRGFGREMAENRKEWWFIIDVTDVSWSDDLRKFIRFPACSLLIKNSKVFLRRGTIHMTCYDAYRDSSSSVERKHRSRWGAAHSMGQASYFRVCCPSGKAAKGSQSSMLSTLEVRTQELFVAKTNLMLCAFVYSNLFHRFAVPSQLAIFVPISFAVRCPPPPRPKLLAALPAVGCDLSALARSTQP